MAAQSTTIQPPQPPPQWDHTPEQIITLTKQAIQDSRDLLDSIAATKPDQANFPNPEILTFYQYVSPEEALRTAAVEADKIIQEYDLEVCSRMDVYEALLAAQKNINPDSLDDESKRLIEKLLIERTRNGLHLDQDSRQKFNQLKNRINNLAIDFQKNLNEEQGKIWFTPEELKGVPEDILSGFEKDDQGRLAMTFKTPDYTPVIQYAIVPETRKRASLGYDSRAAINVPILEEIISLRREAATALGKPNWAAHALEIKMAKKTETVFSFLKDLRQKITPVALKERQELLKIKQEEVQNLGLDTDPTKLYVWDYRYYDRLYTERNLDLKAELVKEYFPVSVVVEVILETYQALLSVKFFQVKDAKLWHPNATQWAVWDSEAVADGRAEKGEGFLGYLHLDLEPRPNKYGHAAVWGLVPGYEKKDGTRHYPVAAMQASFFRVANLAKGTAQKPALLTHDSVVTFFHEMGHVFHQLCSKTKYGRFHGTSVARDFVEAPSQMLENWCWTESQLVKMSQHYLRKDEKLPKELVQKIIASRDVNSGLFNLRQIFFGMYDMYVHTSTDTLDLTRHWCESRDEISLVDSDPAMLSPGQSSFGHIVGGYDAGYYGYLYSQVFSADMYESVFSADPMSAKMGARYRDEILRPGGARDEMVSLTKFLGRPPNEQAFLKRLLRNQV
ncbi:uncharacterized protein PGTG_08304 [Puccinia graminis f. sp. tritici CRL 75-36-700-3]|uniref:Peptidase M3A/M3B catalytic domain-containing protein n=1 Tax=Puccinia graminis f. sp. tritici (strain CRL 75-36-700-3 / race SCCL) TaxID=418459 RepID=E3KDX3_PUCGT|nr:uncharacterized protein PGTG_08304 [Puccinia graminis f. sp. tritici CRL 75-36-700-3]EFP82348.2 hypothetical protein PGTG_08304 [Puccinia graminis f. sp. tritici CRL 75-36-700-3]